MKVQLTVVRKWLSPECTVGELYIGEEFFCYTLEDPVRKASAKKVYGATAIPKGTYQVTLEKSPHFHKLTPRLHNVPGFEGVLVHSGNSAADTKGCILVGYAKLPNNRKIYNNVVGAAFTDLMGRLVDAAGITLTLK